MDSNINFATISLTHRFTSKRWESEPVILELKPEQQKILDRAAKSGMSPEEVLDQAFAVIHEQYRNEDWMLAGREAIAAQIAEGFAQAERGELLDAHEAAGILRDRRAKRLIA
jgi:predicted transcriptional regulator